MIKAIKKRNQRIKGFKPIPVGYRKKQYNRSTINVIPLILLIAKKAMNTLEKLELLKENCNDQTELDRILGQLLSVILTRHHQKLSIYNSDIEKFEQKYKLNSQDFETQFNSGKLGDEIDFFEWFSLCQLRKDILEKISKLQQAV
ncbi:MAG: hypothetical protein VKL41_12450 [Snowella sp.]|nr:hypothetical protein [Snowella sp.]